MRVKKVTHQDGSPYGIQFDCPGCAAPHVIPTTGEKAWGFNQNFDRPTLTPSILVHSHGVLLDDGSVGQSPTCHSFVRDGRIEFLNDCTHALAGKSVDMSEVA
jgi:hypothetical protein